LRRVRRVTNGYSMRTKRTPCEQGMGRVRKPSLAILEGTLSGGNLGKKKEKGANSLGNTYSDERWEKKRTRE